MERYEILIAVTISWFLSQLIKSLYALLKSGGLSFIKTLLRQGGLVSSHSAVVSSLGISCGLTCGFDSAEFAICFVVAALAMADSGGVRYTTGKMSRFLNDTASKEGITEEKFNENLGHTAPQIIFGVLTGIAVSTITHICL